MPRVAEIALTSSWVRFSGSAPDRMSVARFLASSAVKLPVIWPLPPAITLLTVGAEMVSPSSVMEMVLPMLAAVASAKRFAPSSFSSKATHGSPFSS